MPHLSDPSASPALLDTLLRVSLTGMVIYRPLVDATGRITDFAFVRLNEAAQRRLHLSERPTQTYRTHYPHEAPDVFAFYCAAYAAGTLRTEVV